jgi:PA14 domain
MTPPAIETGPAATSALAGTTGTGETRRADDEALEFGRLRQAARAEIDAFLAVHEACAFAPPACAALVRAWHALVSLEAFLRDGGAAPSSDFIEAVRRADRAGWPPGLRDIPKDFTERVLACALSDPWVSRPAPTDRELEKHRRVLLRSFADLDRRVRRRVPALGVPWRRVFRMMALGAVVAALLAVSLRFTVYRPRWRVSYFANVALQGPPAIVTRTPNADESWGPGGPGPPVPNDNFSARFETCLVMKGRGTLIVAVGSDDGSRLLIDGREVISAWTDHPYGKQELPIALEKGIHTVRLEYYERGGGARLTFDARALPGSFSDFDWTLRLPVGDPPKCN